MEIQELLNKKVGTEEKKHLEAKTVKIATINIVKTTNEGKPMKTPIVQVMCKHPDHEDLIPISKIKYQKADKIITAGLWVQLDSQGNIQKSSAIDILLTFLKAPSLADSFGKDINTVFESSDSNFLCLKAY